MYSVEILKKCGCFTKSGMSDVYSFDNKAVAKQEAEKIAQKMNDQFCGKHKFEVLESLDSFKVVESQ